MPEPVTAESLLGPVMERLGGAERAREHQAFRCFENAVGPALLERAQPESLRGTTLFVRVTSSALAHELTMLRQTILERMKLELGDGFVTELRTRVQ